MFFQELFPFKSRNYLLCAWEWCKQSCGCKNFVCSFGSPWFGVGLQRIFRFCGTYFWHQKQNYTNEHTQNIFRTFTLNTVLVNIYTLCMHGLIKIQHKLTEEKGKKKRNRNLCSSSDYSLRPGRFLSTTLLKKMFLKIRTCTCSFFPINFDLKMRTSCSQF